MALDGLDREHVYDLFEKAVKDYICKSPSGVSGGLVGVSLRCHGCSCGAVLPGQEHSPSD